MPMFWSSPAPPPPLPEDPPFPYVLASIIFGLLFPLLLRIRSKIHASVIQLKYRQAAERKRALVKESLDKAKQAGLDWTGFTAWSVGKQMDADAVLAMSASKLLPLLASGKITAEYLTRLYVARAILVDEKLNCVTEQLFEAAVADAQLCDEERRAGQLRGKLHGLPVSIKEQISQAGFDSTCGACCRLFQPAESDAIIVQLLKNAGAIPFCRTNVPQLLMLPESFNAIYGTSNNPFDVTRTPGGSSGGETALLAAHGSPLGIGTDVGGSIRIPAVLCGIYGFKPTVDRLSTKGIAVPRLNNENGQQAVRSAPGPMGHSVADLETIMSVLCTDALMYTEDVALPPVPWDGSQYTAVASSKSLKFGYYISDGWFEPAPACKRAVEETVSALKAAGHEVIEFEPLELADCARNYVALITADGNFRGFVDGIEGEELHPAYSFAYNVANIPKWLRGPLSFIMRNVLKQPRMAKLIIAGSQKTAHEYWEAIKEQNRLKKSFLSRFEASGIDAIICPGLGLPAMTHGTSVRLLNACSYTFVYNNFNMPAGTCPVSTVRADEEVYTDANNSDSVTKLAIKDSIGTAGLPVGVQVVGLPWRDEKCVGAMAVVEAALKAAGHKAPMAAFA